MYDDLQIKRALIVPNGVNLDLFRPMDKTTCRQSLGWDVGKKHVLFPANPSRLEKDFALAQQSVGLLDKNMEIHVFEQVEHQKTPLYFNAADVVLLTSKWEGSPNVVKEALACCAPIVTTKVGDVKERTQGVDGCFVAQTRNPEELAGLLKKALTFEGKTKGREKIIMDGLDNRQVAKNLLSLYESIIG